MLASGYLLTRQLAEQTSVFLCCDLFPLFHIGLNDDHPGPAVSCDQKLKS